MTYEQNDLQIVISHGQSLSVGAGTNSRLSTTPVYPGLVLEVRQDVTGQAYFTDFVTTSFEQPIISMLNTVQANFIRDGAEGPTLVGAMTGSPGKPLLSLYMSSDDRRTDVADGLATTSDGQFFYTHDTMTNTYDSYLNSDGTAILVRNSTYEPNLFDPIIESLHSIKAVADATGYTITDDLVFSLIHGQSDGGGYPGISYAQQLEMLTAKVDAVADEILQKDVKIITVIGQTRYDYPSDQQLKFVETTESSFLGALEFPYQAEFPAKLDWRDGSILNTGVTHLNEIGYSLLGQETGDIIYGALTDTLNEGDYLRIDSLSVEGDTVVVRVAGLKGHLVVDTSIFATEAGTSPPDNLGFALLKGANLSILSAVVSGTDEVTLTLSGAVAGPLTLSIGNNVGFGGTPLRDSVTTPALNPFSVTPLDTAEVKKFLPTQTLVFDDDGLISGTLEAVSSGSSRQRSFGSAVDDMILGTSVSEWISGGSGNDTLVGGGGHDLLEGGSGADSFVLSFARLVDTIADFAPEEGDVINLGAVFESNPRVEVAVEEFLRIEAIDADTSRLLVDPNGNGDGFQTVFVIDHAAQRLDVASLILNGNLVWDKASRQIVEVALTQNDDTFVATDGKDYFIRALSGNDSVTGGAGNDQISGGQGHDTIRSGAGDDTVIYDIGANGFDVVDGGAGLNDRIIAVADGVVIGLAAITGIEEISAADFWNVRIFGTADSDSFDFSELRMIGIAEINSRAGHDIVLGSSSDDVISGGSGNDTINGSDGADFIEGGAGKDFLTGGAGSDTFVFKSAHHSRVSQKADIITDFMCGEDRIDLAAIDADTGRAGDQGFVFIGSAAFSGVAGELRVDTASIPNVTRILADIDGNQKIDMEIMLEGNHLLLESYFLL